MPNVSTVILKTSEMSSSQLNDYISQKYGIRRVNPNEDFLMSAIPFFHYVGGLLVNYHCLILELKEKQPEILEKIDSIAGFYSYSAKHPTLNALKIIHKQLNNLSQPNFQLITEGK